MFFSQVYRSMSESWLTVLVWLYRQLVCDQKVCRMFDEPKVDKTREVVSHSELLYMEQANHVR